MELSMRNVRFTAVAFVIVIGTMLAGCSSINRVSSEEFLIQAKHINRLESAQNTSYIGASKTNAYLEQWRAGALSKQGSTSVIWVPIAELPADIAEKIKAGQNPWQGKP